MKLCVIKLNVTGGKVLNYWNVFVQIHTTFSYLIAQYCNALLLKATFYITHNLNKRSSCNSPVVVRVVPVIKVNQEAVAHFVRYRGNTDERRVHAVHGLQLHPHLEATVCLRLHSQKTSTVFTLSPLVRRGSTALVFDSLWPSWRTAPSGQLEIGWFLGSWTKKTLLLYILQGKKPLHKL